MTRHPVIVIGAGPAGLGAAWELAKQGCDPLVLEAGDKVGGLARTETHKGNRFDIGGHRFYTRNARITALWREMLGRDLLTVKRLSRICYKGRFLKYPLESLDTFANLGPLESALIILSYLKARLVPSAPEETFEQWVTNRFGRRLYLTFFKGYTEKVWGLPCDAIRADWAAQRMGGLSVAAAVTNAVFGTGGARTLAAEFLYPVLGPGMMWERFAEGVETNGGRVRLRAEVVRINHESGRVRSVTVADGDEPFDLSGDSFISSMPLCDLVMRMAPRPPADVVNAAVNLRYRDFILVALVVNGSRLFPDNWIYVHDARVRVARIQNFRNWSAAMVADAGKTCLGMEYFCSEGDELWNMGDFRLVQLAAGELDATGLASRRDVEDGVVIRERKAYPVYDGSYRDKVSVIRRYLSSFSNLQTVGRNGMHRYNNQDHSMLAGMLAAGNVLGGKHDIWDINADRSYGERNLVPSKTAVGP